jgi:hypothetical protein
MIHCQHASYKRVVHQETSTVTDLQGLPRVLTSLSYQECSDSRLDLRRESNTPSDNDTKFLQSSAFAIRNLM